MKTSDEFIVKKTKVNIFSKRILDQNWTAENGNETFKFLELAQNRYTPPVSMKLHYRVIFADGCDRWVLPKWVERFWPHAQNPFFFASILWNHDFFKWNFAISFHKKNNQTLTHDQFYWIHSYQFIHFIIIIQQNKPIITKPTIVFMRHISLIQWRAIVRATFILKSMRT